MQSLISILMPAYNAGRFISIAIDSCRDQTYLNWELVIVDDGSTDDTVEIVERYKPDGRIRIHRQEHYGAVPALNCALELSRGGIIARLDADDSQDRFRLVKQSAAFTSDVQPTLVGCRVRVIDYDGAVLEDADCDLPGRFAHVGAWVMALRSVHEDAGGWLADEEYAADMGWTYRALTAGNKFALVPETLYFYRAHSSQTTTEFRAKHNRDHLGIQKKYGMSSATRIANDGSGRIMGDTDAT